MKRSLELLKNSGALMEGHFLLSSGMHSDKYVQCAQLIMHPQMCQEIAAKIVKRLEGQEFDMVVGPAMGGIIIAYEVARQLGLPAIFTERVEGEMVLRRGFENKLEKDMRVLIVEDVVTTAKSSMESASAIEEMGGKVLALASIVDRTSGKEVPLPLYSAVSLEVETYEADDCPLCKEEIELVKPGSRNLQASK